MQRQRTMILGECSLDLIILVSMCIVGLGSCLHACACPNNRFVWHHMYSLLVYALYMLAFSNMAPKRTLFEDEYAELLS